MKKRHTQQTFEKNIANGSDGKLQRKNLFCQILIFWILAEYENLYCNLVTFVCDKGGGKNLLAVSVMNRQTLARHDIWILYFLILNCFFDKRSILEPKLMISFLLETKNAIQILQKLFEWD